jgi:predicted acetyltransferase
VPPLNIELPDATLADLPVLQTMATYYVYDISEFMLGEPDWEFPETGLYGAPSFQPYFDDPDARVLLIRVNGELGGFAIVDTKGSSPDVEFNMAQFWVHRKYKGRGVGAFAAGQCFARFPGLWEVNVIPRNTAAFAFWRKSIHRIAIGPVEEARRPAPHLRGAIKDIFRFRT